MSNITITTTAPAIILVRDSQEAEVIKLYYPDFIQVNRTADIPHMMWYFKRYRDIILTQNEFCKMIRKSRTHGCEYMDYLANYTLRILGDIDLVETLKISTHDVGLLKNKFCNYDDVHHKLTWSDEYWDYPYSGKFGREKNFADRGGLYYIGHKLYGVVPAKPFEVFRKVQVAEFNYLLRKLFSVYGVSYSVYETMIPDALCKINLTDGNPSQATYTPDYSVDTVLEQFLAYHNSTINKEALVVFNYLRYKWFGVDFAPDIISDNEAITAIRKYINAVIKSCYCN